MKKFLLNLLLFCLPLAVFFALPMALVILGREFLPVADVVARQQAQADSGPVSQEILYSPVVEKPDWDYKLKATVLRNPDIIVYGTSRTLTIQSKYFKNPAEFYNAGSTAAVNSFRTADLVSFINGIPKDSNLKVILWDGSSFLTQPAVGPSLHSSLTNAMQTLLTNTLRNLYISYFQKKFSIRNVLETQSTNKNMGLVARLENTGYRKDGSLERNTKQTPAELQAQVQSDLAAELSSIVPGQGGFVDYSASIPQGDVDEINQFLAICQKRHIYVIGYLSPFATELTAKMQTLDDQYTQVYNQTPLILKQTLSGHGYPFYDIRDLSLIHSSDQELYDAHHPTEKGTIKMLLYLTAKEPRLAEYIDAASLKKQIDKEHY